MKDASQVRQARTYFHQQFTELLNDWSTSEVQLATQLHETTIAHANLAAVLERKPGSTIVCFTGRLKYLLAQQMVDFCFPTDEPKVTKVELERNENPGYSLRAIKEAYRILMRKIPESLRVLRNMNDGVTSECPSYLPEVPKVTRLIGTIIFMDDGLFLIPKIAWMEGGRIWEARWSEEEIQELRVLIQA
jgi:hypothetical protein